jgi:hypothetical protein
VRFFYTNEAMKLTGQVKPKLNFLFSVLFLLVACAQTMPSPTPIPTETSAVSSSSAESSTPVETPLPMPSAQYILDLERAIAYSCELLVNKGLEPELDYQGASSTLVRFPSGDQGVFVAIGFVGIARGYQLLYRVHGHQVELVELRGPGAVEQHMWGVRSLHDSDLSAVGIEHLHLFADASGETQEVLRVVGAGHAGTGFWEDGYFEIVYVTDAGIRVVFSGAEAEINVNTQGWHRQYQYEYTDLNVDGNKEIVKTGEECVYLWEAQTESLQKTDCHDVEEIYRYNGTYFASVYRSSLPQE